MPRDMIRLYVGSVGSIDIRLEIRRLGKDCFSGSSMTVRWSSGAMRIDLARVPRPLFGGERIYWLCPRCSRNCDILYQARGRLACRRCQRLHYWTQALGPVHRRTHGLTKRRERLGQPPGRGLVADFPDKPKWMRWPTYERLAKEAAEREHEHWQAPVGRRLVRAVASLP